MNNLRKNILIIAYPLMTLYWNITRTRSMGIRVLIINERNEILLVKHSYMNYLYPPGGSIKKYEKLKDAGIREVFEEVGIKIESINLSGIYREKYHNKDDTLIIAYANVRNVEKLQIDNVEIIDAGWYQMDNLPNNISPKAKGYIKNYLLDPQKIYFE